MLRWLRDMLLISFVLLAVTVAMPLACFPLVRSREGAMAVFVLGPLSAGVLTLVYSQLSAAPWRRGAEAVRQWRAEQGGMPVTVGKATCWLFGAIFFSYLAETALTLATRSAMWLPVAIYSPLMFAWLWRRTRRHSRG
jgi:hypothetical protein